MILFRFFFWQIDEIIIFFKHFYHLDSEPGNFSLSKIKSIKLMSAIEIVNSLLKANKGRFKENYP